MLSIIQLVIYTLLTNQFFNIIDTKSDAEKKQLYSKIEKYLARAEEIKELVKTGDKGNELHIVFNIRIL